MKNYENIDGFIYVVQFEDYCKIGYSENPNRRLRQIQAMLPKKIDNCYVSCLIPDVMKTEERIHRIFDECRTNGEWFRVSFKNATDIVKRLTIQFNDYGISHLINASMSLSKALSICEG